MNLKKILFDKKIKQNQMANELKINKTTFNNYVNENTQPDIETLVDIANYLDVSLDYLCERPYNNQIGYVQDNRKVTMKKIAELSDKQFDKVEAYVTALIDSEK